jgi:hypothetical protein
MNTLARLIGRDASTALSGLIWWGRVRAGQDRAHGRAAGDNGQPTRSMLMAGASFITGDKTDLGMVWVQESATVIPAAATV